MAVTAIAVLFFVTAAGVPQAMFRAWQPNRLASFRSSGRLLAIVLGAVGISGGAVVFGALRDSVFLGVPTLGYSLLLLSLPFQLHGGFMSAVLTYSGAARAVNTASAVAVIFQSAMFVVGGAFGWLTVSRACGIFLVGAMLQWVIVRRTASRLEAVAADDQPIRPIQLIRAGLGLQPYVLANFLLLRIDVFFLAQLGDAADLGRYAVAVALAEVVWSLTDSILLPAIERSSNADAIAEDQFNTSAVRMTILVGGCGALTVAAGSPLLIPLLYGGDFEGAVGAIVVLLPGIVLMGVWRVVSLTTVRFGSTGLQPAISVLALLVNCGLNVLLIPHHGAVGAAAASSASYLVAAALTLRWVVSRGTTTWRELVPGRADLAQLRATAVQLRGRG